MIRGSARSRSVFSVRYPFITVTMKQPTNDTIEPALCWVPISVKTAPLMSSNGPTNIHKYQSRALTRSHETTPAHIPSMAIFQQLIVPSAPGTWQSEQYWADSGRAPSLGCVLHRERMKRDCRTRHSHMST